MRREWRGSTCIYCGKQMAVTEDHVIGRKFFPERLRGNLPKAPACAKCNNEKSKLESYVMAVLPFGSMHPAGQEMLKTMGKRRFEKNERLRRELREGQKVIRVRYPDGTTEDTISVPFDSDKWTRLCEMIIRGLLFHHFGQAMPQEYRVHVFHLTDTLLRWFKEEILSLSPDQFQDHSLADGAFRYQFTASPNDSFLSAWVLELYDLFGMCGQTEDGKSLRTHTTAITGPPEIEPIVAKIRETLAG